MKALLFAMYMVLMIGCTSCASLPSHADLRATALRVETTSGFCSGTALSPSTLLTAYHCLHNYRNDGSGVTRIPTPITKINGIEVKAIKITVRDTDYAFITLDKPIFKSWAKIGLPPAQGDPVRWWGNPLGATDVYREGYVSRTTKEEIVVVGTICKGDSGAGLFNSVGKLVGMITGMNDMNGCTFMLSHSMTSA